MGTEEYNYRTEKVFQSQNKISKCPRQQHLVHVDYIRSRCGPDLGSVKLIHELKHASSNSPETKRSVQEV